MQYRVCSNNNNNNDDDDDDDDNDDFDDNNHKNNGHTRRAYCIAAEIPGRAKKKNHKWSRKYG